RDRLVDVKIGSPIPARNVIEFSTPEERTEYLRWRTYVLANRPEHKAQTSAPLRTRTRRAGDAVHSPAEPALLAGEISALSADDRLTNAGEFEVYIAPANRIPRVLQEIGRLREVTFRAAGEGTGKSVDLDRFDANYLHLFAWNPQKDEVVGAYRL